MSDIKEATDTEGRVWRIHYDVTTSTTPYFSAAFGNWLPGDDAEIEVTAAELELEPGNWVEVPLRQAEKMVDLEAMVAE